MRHVLPDVLQKGLDTIFCGTAASAESARRGAYYAGPGNKFWRTLFEVRLTDRQLEPSEFRSLTRFGLGLTDLSKSASGSDASLPRISFDPEGLARKIRRHEPRILAFTSKRAAQEFVGDAVEYGLLRESIGATRLFVLPSPSGAACGHWDIEPWRDLARLREGSRLSRA